MNNVSDINSPLVMFWETIANFWWIILPPALWQIFMILWVDFTGWYGANSWTARKKWTILEIIPPREIERGPKMMENIFTGLAGVLTTYHTFGKYIEGAWYHDRFSFELVGDQGKVHFYIRTQTNNRNLVESHIYAQYPDAEVREVSDYTQNFPKIVPNRDWDLWGADFDFVAPDPIPIKTYDRFEETVTGEMIDPMSAIAEVMGALGPNQHIWLQYILQPIPEPDNKKNSLEVIKKLKGEKVAEVMGVGGHFADVLKNIIPGMLGTHAFATTKKEELQPLEFRLSPTEKELLKATEENIGKNHFKTKMRYILVGRKENFDKSNTSAFVGAIKQFNDINFNQVKPEEISKTYGKIFFTKFRADFRKRKIYGRYIKRNMDDAKITLSTKELATLYHFPDMNVKSPSITRVEAKLGSAPSNLPVE